MSNFSNIHTLQINEISSIYLLSYSEFDPNVQLIHLLPEERDRLESIGNVTRKREYISTRLLRNSLFGKKMILYSPIGAPYLENKEYISISHTKSIVGIALSEYKIGFDLEPIRDKAKKIHSKFLHREEIRALNNRDDLEMTIAWSLKESLYKLAGRKKIIFKDELRIEKCGENWRGTIFNPSETIFVEMKVFHSGNNVLTVNSSPLEIKQKNI